MKMDWKLFHNPFFLRNANHHRKIIDSYGQITLYLRKRLPYSCGNILAGIWIIIYHDQHKTNRRRIRMKFFFLIGLLFVFTAFSFAQDSVSTSVASGDMAISQGDIILGGKLALGAVYGTWLGYIVSGEYGFKDNLIPIPNFPNSLGIGGSIAYSGYSSDVAWGNKKYTTKYANYVFLASGFWHVDLLKNPQFDTYAIANVGFNIDTISKPEDYQGDIDSYGGLVWGISAGARYFFMPNLSVVGEVGFGMGLLRIGLDYKL